MEDKKEEENKPLLNDFENKTALFSKKLIPVVLAVVLLGVGSGYLLSTNKGAIEKSNLEKLDSSSLPEGTVVGSDDLKTFRDIAEGILKKGGIEGEGQYHLVRPGGDSQNVYMTSSIVDLSKFLDRKIKVWGETQGAQKAGWLMDVGRVEVLE